MFVDDKRFLLPGSDTTNKNWGLSGEGGGTIANETKKKKRQT